MVWEGKSHLSPETSHPCCFHCCFDVGLADGLVMVYFAASFPKRLTLLIDSDMINGNASHYKTPLKPAHLLTEFLGPIIDSLLA
jgi:hypothetical protein